MSPPPAVPHRRPGGAAWCAPRHHRLHRSRVQNRRGGECGGPVAGEAHGEPAAPLQLACVPRAHAPHPHACQDFADRSRRLFGLAATLKRASHALRMAVIVTNQATDVFDDGGGADCGVLSAEAQQLTAAPAAVDGPCARTAASASPCGPSASTDDSCASGPTRPFAPLVSIGGAHAMQQFGDCALHANGRTFRACLGLAWDQCVTTRIMLAYERSGHAWALPLPPTIRQTGAAGVAVASSCAAEARVPSPAPVFAVPAAAGTRSAWLLRSPGAPRSALRFEVWPGGSRAVGALCAL